MNLDRETTFLALIRDRYCHGSSEVRRQQLRLDRQRLRLDRQRFGLEPAAAQAGPAEARAGPAAAQAGPAATRIGPAAAQAGPAATQVGPAAARGGPVAARAGPAAARAGLAAARAGPAAARARPAALDRQRLSWTSSGAVKYGVRVTTELEKFISLRHMKLKIYAYACDLRQIHPLMPLVIAEPCTTNHRDPRQIAAVAAALFTFWLGLAAPNQVSQ